MNNEPYENKIQWAKSFHEYYPGAMSHSMMFSRNDVLDAFDRLTELFVNDKVTMQCGKGNYYVVIEFNNDTNNK